MPENKYDVHVAKQRVKLIKAEEKQSEKPLAPISEGNEDQCAMDVRAVIHNNLIVIGWAEGSKKHTILRGLHVGGQILLVPFHFFENAKVNDKFILSHRLNPIFIEYVPEKLVRPEGKDWCLYDCGARFEPRRSVAKYFIDENSLGKNTKMSALLCNVTPDGVQTMMKGTAKAIENYEYKDALYGNVYKQAGWETDFSTQAGDCGSLLIALAPSLPPPGKVLGIHTAGYARKSSGFSVLVTRQQLEKALEMVKPQVYGMPVPQEVRRDSGLINELRVIPEGDYSLYGIMPNALAPAQPMKTNFVATPFPEETLKSIPNPKKPAALHPFTNDDGLRISPLKNAADKYGHQTISFPVRNVAKAKAHIKNVLKNKLKSLSGKIFTEQEAIVGIEGVEFADRLNMKSSCGWPYQVLDKKSKGKFHLFDDEGNIVHDELKQRLQERHEAAKKGERVASLWRDCLKDELRPIDKVKDGKTRLFTIAPVDYTILVRQYFMSFAKAFYENNTEFFSGVGINPESYEWTKLYNRLARTGRKAFGLDYKTFDGKLFPELMEAAGDIIDELLVEAAKAEGIEMNYVEASNVRRVLINEMIHTMQLIENCVYATHQGNPSGNPLTVIINTIVNYFYLLLCFMEIYPDAVLADFEEYISVICYGDDVCATVMEKFEMFNFLNIQKVLAKYKIEITSDVKADTNVAAFKDLDEITFLKRGFRRDPEFGNQFVLPTMAKETLWSYFHWVRKAEDFEEQLNENMRNALHFAAFHGRTFYEEYLGKWQACMRAAKLEPIAITFEEQVDVFLYSSRMYVDRGNERQYFNNIQAEGGLLTETPRMAEAEQRNPWGVFWKAMDVAKWGLGAWLLWKTAELGQRARKIKEAVDKVNYINNKEKTDSRYAICIPSGEGKTTLTREFPELFHDHDELILTGDPDQEGTEVVKSWKDYETERVKSFLAGREMHQLTMFEKQKGILLMTGWYMDWVRMRDFPQTDRRVLLTHAPGNTNRVVLGSFILPEPTGVRNNLGGRDLIKHIAEVLSYRFRNSKILQLTYDVEPQLFVEAVFDRIRATDYFVPTADACVVCPSIRRARVDEVEADNID